MSLTTASSSGKCRVVFKVGVIGAALFTLLQYVYGAAVFNVFRSRQGRLAYDATDANDTQAVGHINARHLLDRSAWTDLGAIVHVNRAEQTTVNLPGCPLIPPNLSKSPSLGV